MQNQNTSLKYLKKNAEQAWESNLEPLHCKLYSIIEICQEGKILVYLPHPPHAHIPPPPASLCVEAKSPTTEAEGRI